jgi:hypothetical protein
MTHSEVTVVKRSISFTLSIARRRGGVIHLYAKDGKRKLFVSTVNPRAENPRGHAHLYSKLDKLLRVSMIQGEGAIS